MAANALVQTRIDGAVKEEAATVLAAMVAEPRLIERPLVETEKGARLCRPKEKVLEIL